MIATAPNLKSLDGPVEIDIVVLVPKRGADAGFDGVVGIVKGHLGDLAPQLMEKVKTRLLEVKNDRSDGAPSQKNTETKATDLPVNGSPAAPLAPPPAPPRTGPPGPPERK
jgi:hypothetical protein